MIFSQTNSEIKQIIQNYDVEAIKNLEIEFKKHKEEVDNRINVFLEQNKTAKRIIVTTAKNYYLDDIVDKLINCLHKIEKILYIHAW